MRGEKEIVVKEITLSIEQIQCSRINFSLSLYFSRARCGHGRWPPHHSSINELLTIARIFLEKINFNRITAKKPSRKQTNAMEK